MILGQNFWDMIAIVIALYFLYEDFNTTTTSLLEKSNKTINQIQSIFQSKEVKNPSKRAIEDTKDLAIAFRDKGPKKKARSDNECYNCHKPEHFGRDCFLPDRRLKRTTKQFRRKKLQKRDSRRKRQNKN